MLREAARNRWFRLYLIFLAAVWGVAIFDLLTKV
jgi:hypothetical protein